MATLINQALFRIDPTEGLLQYVQAVKPFHSKVLDVLVEYVYTEPLTVTVLDKYNLNIGLPVTDVDDPLRRSQTSVTYSRGYGYAYAAYSDTMVGGLPQATIVQAQGPITLNGSVSGTVLTTVIDDTGYTLPNDTLVTLSTTGSFPTVVGQPIAQGATYYVVGAVGNTCSISETIGGPPIVFTSPGTGLLRVIPLDLPVNSFLFEVPAPVPYEIAVASVANSQLLFATSYAVVGINGPLQQWRVSGNQISTFVPGLRIYLNNNVDPNANKSYVVTGSSYDSGTAQTTITVQEPLSLGSTASGIISIPQPADVIPFWPAGSGIRFTSSGTLPFPLQPLTTYYVVPTTTVGVFQLSTLRYPQRPSDIIDLLTLGTGVIQGTRVEPFLPGELVEVTGSYQGINDGKYVLTRIETEGPYFRAFTREFVAQTTPVGELSDGTMGFVGTYGDPVGDIVTSPQLYTATYFHERIDFAFGPVPLAAYLMDGFSGIGSLADHISDSGHQWSTFQVTDNLSQLILSGSGVTTADTDIWARSNWTPPADPTTFYVEVDVAVQEHPGTGSPYFRFYAKEANLIDFYGPHIDIFPNLATGKIGIELWLGDDTVGTFFTTDTAVNVNSSINVRMELVNQNQVRIYVNGTLIHTSVTVSWPTLTFAGFNFRVPAGDPKQFRLEKFQASA